MTQVLDGLFHSVYNRVMGRKQIDAEERIHKYTDKSSGCWIWKSGKQGKGYGSMSYKNKPTAAHRVSYEVFIGKIPSSMQIDHLCMNKLCVNPEHLEVVDNKENQRRAAIVRGGYPIEMRPFVIGKCLICGKAYKTKLPEIRKYCSNACRCKAKRLNS